MAAVSLVALLHVVAAIALPAATIAAAYRVTAPRPARAAVAVALAAALTLVTGALRQHAFEPTRRRAVSLASHTAGEWLDRKTHLGFAACCFALAAALVALDRSAPRWLARALYIAAACFALAAFVLLAFVHARTPTASLD